MGWLHRTIDPVMGEKGQRNEGRATESVKEAYEEVRSQGFDEPSYRYDPWATENCEYSRMLAQKESM
jgi:hypothetical protein